MTTFMICVLLVLHTAQHRKVMKTLKRIEDALDGAEVVVDEPPPGYDREMN